MSDQYTKGKRPTVWPFRPCLIDSYDYVRTFARDMDEDYVFPAAGEQPGCIKWQSENHRTPCPQWYWTINEPSANIKDVPLPSIPRDMQQRIRAKALEALPSLGDGLPDIAVFLSELGDLAGICERKGRGLIERAAEERLRWKFVAKPTMSDLNSIMKRIHYVGVSLNDFARECAGQIYTRTFRVRPESKVKMLSGFPPGSCVMVAPDPETGIRPSCGFANSFSNLVTRSKVSGACTIRFSIRVSDDLIGVHNSLAEKLARWRLLPTAGSVWEKIPFSFVVDWFLDTSQFLEHLKFGADTLMKLVIHDFCWSIRQSVEIQNNSHSHCMSGSSYTGKRDRYSRYVGWDNLLGDLPLTKIPKWDQIVTGLALAVSTKLLPVPKKLKKLGL